MYAHSILLMFTDILIKEKLSKFDFGIYQYLKLDDDDDNKCIAGYGLIL